MQNQSSLIQIRSLEFIHTIKKESRMIPFIIFKD